MVSTPNFGIEIPDESVVPSRQSWIEDPILSVDAKVMAYLRDHFRRGSGAGEIPANESYVDVSVAFDPAFGSAPTVIPVLRAVTTGPYQLILSSLPKTTGFTVRLMRPTGASTAAKATLAFDWTASDLPMV